jgi:hypothetical protein
MTIKIIKQVENTHKTDYRPHWYVTYLVECSECWKQYLMLKKNIKKTDTCKECVIKRLADINRKPIELRKRKPPKRHLHHMKWTHFYKKRVSMIWRCNYPCVNGYKNYGGRWIKCEWNSFEEFRDDMYESYLEFIKEHGEWSATLDRIDTNWNYNKENCRWKTMLEQQSNKRNNHRVVYKWKEYPTMKWLCELMWKNYYKVAMRINKYWWSVEDAIDK